MDISDRSKISEKMNEPIQQSVKHQETNPLPLQHLNLQDPQPVMLMQSYPVNQVYANQPYTMPIIISQNPQNIIIKNQILPSLTPIKFSSVYPKTVDCPYCNRTIKTEVEENFNVFTCIYCCILIILFPLAICNLDCKCSINDCFNIIFCCECNKCNCDCCDCCDDCRCDCKCCMDGTHYCPICRTKLGKYNSCCN